jgi:hypothetical protein
MPSSNCKSGTNAKKINSEKCISQPADNSKADKKLK